MQSPEPRIPGLFLILISLSMIGTQRLHTSLGMHSGSHRACRAAGIEAMLSRACRVVGTKAIEAMEYLLCPASLAPPWQPAAHWHSHPKILSARNRGSLAYPLYILIISAHRLCVVRRRPAGDLDAKQRAWVTAPLIGYAASCRTPSIATTSTGHVRI